MPRPTLPLAGWERDGDLFLLTGTGAALASVLCELRSKKRPTECISTNHTDLPMSVSVHLRSLQAATAAASTVVSLSGPLGGRGGRNSRVPRR
jgi:hypothetical protein